MKNQMTMTTTPDDEKSGSNGHKKPAAPAYHFVDYRRSNALYHADFCSLLIEQGNVHGREITLDRADIVAKQVGAGLKTTFICQNIDGKMGVKGMMTLTRANTAKGTMYKLEDIVVPKADRNQGYGEMLFNHLLIDAWENGLAGVKWQTSRANIPAHALFRKFDPSFDIDKLADVWCLSSKRCTAIAEGQGNRAVLANTDSNHITAMSNAIYGLPDKNVDRIAQIVQAQQTGPSDSLVVIVPETGSFGMGSMGFSTFDGCPRMDMLPYFKEPDAAANGFKDAMRKTVNAVCDYKHEYDIPGDLYIEFPNAGDPRQELFIQKAMKDLSDLGGEILQHKGSPMVACELSGKDYVRAVMKAAKDLGRPLSKSAAKRAKDAVKFHRLIGLAA
jgi:Acetyltransferase (GNAT) family